MLLSAPRAAAGRRLLVCATTVALLVPGLAADADARKRPVSGASPAVTATVVGKPQRGLAAARRAGGRATLRGTTMGLNAGGPLFAGGGDAARTRLATLAGAGARVIRFDASWSGVEPAAPVAGLPPLQRFRGLDERVLEATRAGLRPLLMLGYGTPWATPGGEVFAVPRDPHDFARYAGSVARRYAPGAAFWADHGMRAPAGGVLYEIWNEPNAEMFLRGQPTAAPRYATLLLHAQRAVRAADARARITTGGLVPIGASRFVADMLRAEPALRREIAAIGWHPYERTGEAVVRITRQLRRDLDAQGLTHVPLDVTEVGWSEAELAEPRRSTELAVALRGLRAADLGVELLVPYVAMDRDGADTYGLWRTTGEATSSVAAFSREALRTTGR